jgi:hypothetical protein
VRQQVLRETVGRGRLVHNIAKLFSSRLSHVPIVLFSSRFSTFSRRFSRAGDEQDAGRKRVERE